MFNFKKETGASIINNALQTFVTVQDELQKGIDTSKNEAEILTAEKLEIERQLVDVNSNIDKAKTVKNNIIKLLEGQS